MAMNSVRGLAIGIWLSAFLTAQESQVHSLGALLESGFVRIPAGEFNMGSRAGNADEQPVHPVRIRESFEMSKYEITQAQWESVMRNPHAAATSKNRGPAVDVNPSHFKDPAKPVENVSWESIQEFIAALNKRDEKYAYRLPTEAEWEYAARAGSTEESPKNLDAIAWYEGNAGGTTRPVGQKTANAWGLHDMLGNVLEWVSDWYRPYGNPAAADPDVTPTGSYKVYRGCGWHSEPEYCRPAFRAFDFPVQGQYTIGFRLVRTPK